MNNTQNTTNTLTALIDRTLAIIDNGLDRNVGDMTLMQAMQFVGILMDMRERQLVYIGVQSQARQSMWKGMCKKAKRK